MVKQFLRQLFCFHNYKPIKMYYKIHDYIDITLYTYMKCTKCNKYKTKKINSFSCLFDDDKRTIIDLLERHGAESYYKFLQEQIEEGE